MATLNAINKENSASIYAVGFDKEACTLVVKTNGGTVNVEVQLDTAADEWIVHTLVDTDSVTKVEANGCNVRLTPAGGAEFAFIRP